MHLEKAKKRIAKQVQKGDRGYPRISLEYFGVTKELATEVVVTFLLDEGAEAQQEQFSSNTDVREDETIQSVLVKIIERANAKSVIQADEITLIE